MLDAFLLLLQILQILLLQFALLRLDHVHDFRLLSLLAQLVFLLGDLFLEGGVLLFEVCLHEVFLLLNPLLLHFFGFFVVPKVLRLDPMLLLNLLQSLVLKIFELLAPLVYLFALQVAHQAHSFHRLLVLVLETLALLP